MHYARAMQQSFEREMCAAAITCSRAPTFQLYRMNYSQIGLGASSPLAFDPNSRCFKPVKGKDDFSFLIGLMNSF
jgi:hypothetical protein